MNIRILQNMNSGVALAWGLGTRMPDPYVYVVFWAPTLRYPHSVLPLSQKKDQIGLHQALSVPHFEMGVV